MDARERDIVKRSVGTFGDQKFSPVQFVDTHFQTHAIDTAATYKQDLDQQKEIASKALKLVVFEQYKVFTKSTTEIRTLQSDLNSLKTSIADIDELLKNMKNIKLGITIGESKTDIKAPISTTVPLANQWLLEAPDDLESYISQKKYDLAVQLNNKVLDEFKSMNPIIDGLRESYERMMTVNSKLSAEIVNEIACSHDLVKLKEYTSYLYSLGKKQLSQQLYLENISQTMDEGIKNVLINKSFLSYVKEFSKITFTSITTTYKDFPQLFDEYDLSALVVFCYDEYNQFVERITTILPYNTLLVITRDQFILFYDIMKVIYEYTENNTPYGINVTAHILKKMCHYIQCLLSTYMDHVEALSPSIETLTDDISIIHYFRTLYPQDRNYHKYENKLKKILESRSQ